MPLPKGVFKVTKPHGRVYWYHQDRRGKPDAGEITRLPEFGTPEFWAEMARITGRPTAPKNTIGSLIDTYTVRGQWSDGTGKTYRSALARIREAWGDLDPAEITTAGVMALQDSFATRPAMGNMVLGQVKALMKLAVQQGLRRDNPAREIDKMDEEGDGAAPLTEQAWAALMSDTAPIMLRRGAFLGRATGQRISDLVRMRACHRDQDGLKVWIKKLGEKEHWCMLRPPESAVIDGWKVFKNAAYLTRADGKLFSENKWRDLWNEFAATEAGAPLRGFTPHDLRATKVCDERIRGLSHQRIAAIVGMSVGQVMNYSRHIDQRLVAKGTRTEQE